MMHFPDISLHGFFSALAARLQEAMLDPQFYAETTGLAIAAFLGILTAMAGARLLRKFHARYTGPFDISSELVEHIIHLLNPICVIILISLWSPLAGQYIGANTLSDEALTLTGTWLLVRLIFAIVRARSVAWIISIIIIILSILSATGFLPITTKYLSDMAFQIGKYRISMLNLIHALIIFVVVFWLAGTLSKGLRTYLTRFPQLNYSTRELITKLFTVLVYFTAFMITLSALGVDLTALAVFSGALGVGIGLGLQKLTANFVSGVTLLVERSIKIGDIVEIGNITGTIRQLQMRYALIETADGRELMVPNEELISTKLTNWTYSNQHARIEISITIEYHSNVKLAQKLMLEAALAHPKCQEDPEPFCVLQEFTDIGMQFLLTFWIPDIRDGRLKPQSEVMFAIVERFRANGITFASSAPIPAPKDQQPAH